MDVGNSISTNKQTNTPQQLPSILADSLKEDACRYLVKNKDSHYFSYRCDLRLCAVVAANHFHLHYRQTISRANRKRGRTNTIASISTAAATAAAASPPLAAAAAAADSAIGAVVRCWQTVLIASELYHLFRCIWELKCLEQDFENQKATHTSA